MRTITWLRVWTSMFWLVASCALPGCATTANVVGDLTNEDVAAIKAAVRKQTWQRILTIRQKPDGEVSVLTGRVRGVHDASGKSYRLKKENGHWRIIASGFWIT
jgi:hypothetical protein